MTKTLDARSVFHLCFIRGKMTCDHRRRIAFLILAMNQGVAMSLEFEELTKEIIGAAFTVHGVLGYGFLESVYPKAMQVELTKRGVQSEREFPITVYYERAVVGDFEADLFVERCVIVEIKVAKHYCSDNEAQLLNELKATGVKVGLLINFGREKVEFKRFVY